MKWLDCTLPTPAENLALDEALLDAAESGAGGEVLRFWESAQDFVVVGYANKLAMEADLAACAERGIPVLRRCSGGGTVLQGPGSWNYSLVLKIGNPAWDLTTITDTNRFVMEQNRAVVAALLAGQGEVRVQGHTDLTWDGKKFSGNAQRRRRDYLLFHGTFLLDYDLAKISAALPMPSWQPTYRAERTHGDFLVNLGVRREDLQTGLKQRWGAREELVAVPDVTALVQEKYGRAEWNEKF